jgi:hypothetical protein
MSDTSGEVLRLELVYASDGKEKMLLDRLRTEKPITPSEQRFLSDMLADDGNTEFQLKLLPRKW